MKTSRAWVIALAFWAVYAIFEALQTIEFEPASTLAEGLLAALPPALLLWAPLTVAMLAVARRDPLMHGPWPQRLLKLLGVTFAVLALRMFGEQGLDTLCHIVAPAWYEPPAPLFDQFFARFFSQNVKLLQIVGFAYAWAYVQSERENRERIAELETGVARARLDAMAAQLNPDFLFDTLRGIARLAYTDAHAADHMLTTFSSLLRFSLAHRDDTIDVNEEVELAGQYLAIEKIRLGGRLDAQWSVDPGAADARVPALIVQSLAERLIPREAVPDPLTLRISIHREDDALAVAVAASGGRRPDFTAVSARLDGLYRGRSTLVADAAGVRVTLPQG